jgi:hypothetical protein
VSFEEFKKIIAKKPEAKHFTEEELKKLYEVVILFSNFAYKAWVEKRYK